MIEEEGQKKEEGKPPEGAIGGLDANAKTSSDATGGSASKGGGAKLKERIEGALDRFFARSGGAVSLDGNRIELLIDSKENFPRWKEVLASAKEEILIEMYIFDETPFAVEMRDLLAKKAREGVAVILIYDWWGSMVPSLKGFFKPISEAGGLVLPFNKMNIFKGYGFLSRNHRKSIIVDAKIAFVSGLCISSNWEGDPSRGQEPWRDTGLELEGPVVDEVRLAFWRTFDVVAGGVPEDLELYDSPEAGGEKARIVATTPDNTNMVRMDISAISMARKYIWITDAYFMPNKMYLQALINASLDGVDVRLLVPKTSDIRWIEAVSKTQYRRLLKAGVRIFEWNGSMVHAKSSVIDGVWARVGSTNLNYSSWFNNRELDVVLESEGIVKKLEDQFVKDMGNSTEIVLMADEMGEDPRLGIKDAVGAAGGTPGNESGLPHEGAPFIFKHGNKSLNKMKRIAAFRHVKYIGGQIGNMFSGERHPVERSEFAAYLGLSIILLLVSLLIWFIPAIFYIPLLIVILGVLGVTVGRTMRIGFNLFKARDEKAPELVRVSGGKDGDAKASQGESSTESAKLS